MTTPAPALSGGGIGALAVAAPVSGIQRVDHTRSVLCKRKWTRRRGWHDVCRTYRGWSAGYTADLRSHPALKVRCWKNRWGYIYCPNASTWSKYYINRRCRLDGRGNLLCPPR